MYRFFFIFYSKKVKKVKKRGGGGKKEKNSKCSTMLKNILENVCQVIGIPEEKISGKDRTKNIVVGRQLYCYIAREHFRYNLTEIAHSINKDHTTVIHSHRNVKNMLDVNDDLWAIPYKVIMDRIREQSKSELKLHIQLHDMTNPSILINELLAKYDCTINVIY